MVFFVKNFISWFRLKIKIDGSNHKPPFFREGEVWWCSTGENIGGEISGKGPHFRRPVLIVRKLDRFSFVGIPLTSRYKEGTWYFALKVKDRDNFAVLSQVRHTDYRRMDKILCTIPTDELCRIKKAVTDLLEG